MKSRPALLAGAAVAAVAVLALAGTYVYFFSGLRSAPRALSLDGSPQAAPPATSAPTATPAASPATTGALAGTWTVASGSLARYRVKEVFAGQTSSHEAVAQTTSMSGTGVVRDTAGGDVVTNLKLTAKLSGLQSVDSVAGYNVSQRDRIVQDQLAVASFPEATFEAQNVTLPAAIDTGGTVALTIPGRLTIHGVTRAVQVAVSQARLSGGQFQAVGSVSFAMTDFGVQPPRVPITTVDPQVTLEFQVNLART